MKTFSFSLTVSFLFCALLFGCSKEVATSLTSQSNLSQLASLQDLAGKASYKTYTIEEGNHYANGIHFPHYSGTLLSFTAIFDSSAIYNFTDPHIEYDQNTLYGFADNGDKHERYSARFGWRWFNNELQIAAYTINDSIPTIVEIGSVPLGTASSYSIAVNGDQYAFTLNGVTTFLPRQSTTANAGKYKLLPYFGGDATAPQTITIQIKNN